MYFVFSVVVVVCLGLFESLVLMWYIQLFPSFEIFLYPLKKKDIQYFNPLQFYSWDLLKAKLLTLDHNYVFRVQIACDIHMKYL